MAWIDTYGDRDGDGFQEYRTRSSHGYYNQGWKDAGDAILQADGSIAELPIGVCGLQGYAYDAKLRLGDIYETLDRLDDAERLRAEHAASTSASTTTSGGRARAPTTWASTARSTPSSRLPRTRGIASPAASSRRIAPGASSNG